MQQDFDIIIAGTGLAGCAMAACLQGQGLNVGLMEFNPPAFLQAPDERPLSLSYASIAILNSLNQWTKLAPESTPIKRVRVSQQGSFGQLEFDHQDLNLPFLGQVVPYFKLHQTLYNLIPHENIIQYQKIHSLTTDETQLAVNFNCESENSTIKTKLLIAADGARSPCRDLLGITLQTQKSGHAAAVFNLSLDQNHPPLAQQRYTPHGSFATLPMSASQQCQLVWTMKQSYFDQLNAMSELQREQQIKTTLKGFTPNTTAIKKMGSYPLQQSCADKQTSHRAILLGAAARSLYPTTAQGFNLIMRDSAALAELICAAQHQQQDIGSADLLQRFVKDRAKDHRAVTSLTQFSYDLFDLNLPLLPTLRGLGMAALNIAPGIKKSVAKKLLGLTAPLPTLALNPVGPTQ